MIVHYADTSALVRCYFPDEPDHDELRGLLFEDAAVVVSSELTRVEFASAVTAAERLGRIEKPSALLDRFDADCSEGGPVALLALDAAVVVPAARQLVIEHELRTLDALHLGVVTTTVRAFVEGSRPTGERDDDRAEIVVVTRDGRQADAARAVGFAVR